MESIREKIASIFWKTKKKSSDDALAIYDPLLDNVLVVDDDCTHRLDCSKRLFHHGVAKDFKWSYPESCLPIQKMNISYVHKEIHVPKIKTAPASVQAIQSVINDSINALSDTKEKIRWTGDLLTQDEVNHVYNAICRVISFYDENTLSNSASESEGARMALIKLEKNALVNHVNFLERYCKRLEEENDSLRKDANIARKAHSIALDAANDLHNLYVNVIKNDPRLDQDVSIIKKSAKHLINAGYLDLRSVALLTYHQLLDIKGIGWSSGSDIVTFFKSSGLPSILAITKEDRHNIGHNIDYREATRINSIKDYQWSIPDLYGKNRRLSFALTGHSNLRVVTDEPTIPEEAPKPAEINPEEDKIWG